MSEAPTALEPVGDTGAWGVKVRRGSIVLEQPAPVAVLGADFDALGRAVGYTLVEHDRGRLHGTVDVDLAGGGRLRVRDEWTVEDDGDVCIRRSCLVDRGGSGGFGTRLSLRRPSSAATTWVDVEPFIPGVTYGNDPRVPAGALGGQPTRASVRAVLVREDRTSAPVVAVRWSDGSWLATSHAEIDGATIAADCTARDGGETLVDERLRYASLGGVLGPDGLEIGLWYPGTEGEYTHSSGPLPLKRPHQWRWRLHPVRRGLKHEYTVRLRLGTSASFTDMVASVWRAAWQVHHPLPEPADMAAVVEHSVRVLASQVRSNGVRTGVPLEVDAVAAQPDGFEVTDALMGFVGANTDCGALLLREADLAVDRSNAAVLHDLGSAILDSFAALPLDPPAGEGFGARGGWSAYRTYRDRPAVYARSLAEGCLATLEAARRERSAGRPHPRWESWAEQGGRWIVRQQRADGWVPRAWEAGTGAVLDESTSSSAVVVPFLLALASATGQSRYLDAGRAAGEHAQREADRYGVFAGGTLDNPDVVDKEAAVLAAEAFLGLHQATGQDVWLERALAAARLAETWIYIWDVPMPVDADDTELHWKRGAPTRGHQLITTGASMTDGFLAVNAALFARLWSLTGDEHWLQVARLVTHGTTTMLALPGRTFDLRGPGWQQEHWAFGGRRGFGLNRRWLPWVAVAHVRGVHRLLDLGTEVATAVLT